jgi:hypothetical protein
MLAAPVPDIDRWRAEIDGRMSKGADLEFAPADFAASTNTKWPNPSLSAFLDGQAAAENLRRIDVMLCPGERCHSPLDAGMLQIGECPFCGLAFAEEDEDPIPSARYRILGEASRDIRWMVVVHGMNTRGVWQEIFSWLIANRLKYSAPVLIHKYGWATIDVLFEPMHLRLAKSLGRKIRRAAEYARRSGITDAPDILVHSFGSRLFSLILVDDEFTDLKFGRVITAGSIIRPDFDWSSLIREGRVEAVLNHMGGKDIPVLVAQFVIPGTGPGGRKGYQDSAVLNQQNTDFGHSDCLSEENVDQALRDGGIWHRFLTQPAGLFVPDDLYFPKSWKPALGPLRWVPHVLGALVWALLAPLAWIRRKVDR